MYWAVVEADGLASWTESRLAVAFMLDALVAVGLLAWLFATRPPGPVRWGWFVVLSFVGGLGFSIPFHLWLNQRLDRRLARRPPAPG